MDFFQKYFNYIGQTEAPKIYHRWSAISAVGALLGRQYYLPFGHGAIYPNQYIMLMGSPGARKSTAIKAAQKAVKRAGYTKFAADRMSKEQFLKSMMQAAQENLGEEYTVEDLLDLVPEAGHEMYIVADEFTDFIGQGNMEFATMLTKLWDTPSEYKHPKLTGMDVIIDKPTVNLLSGNTPTGFTLAFPPEALGQGFTSRLLFVYSEPTGTKITFPEPPSDAAIDDLTAAFLEVSECMRGAATLSSEAERLAESMYAEFPPLDDWRFANYCTRRFDHLLKLALCLSACKLRMEITEETLLEANTLLHYTECKMSSALGEYGRSRNSPVQQDILECLNKTAKPLTMNDLWRAVGQDLNKQSELVNIMKGMLLAHKVRTVDTGHGMGFFPNHMVREEWGDGLILSDYLTLEEMG